MSSAHGCSSDARDQPRICCWMVCCRVVGRLIPESSTLPLWRHAGRVTLPRSGLGSRRALIRTSWTRLD
eukprot:35664-Eustigmatos_ZCMA.PRE.1